MSSQPPPFIDYTQYKDFAFCEQKWFERFVNCTQRTPWDVGPGGDDSPLVLGELVHDGLERYRVAGTPEFTPDLIGRLNASGETAAWARMLLQAYVKRYPAENFPLFKCEASVRFDLGLPDITGFAKIDYWFEITEQQEFDSGLGWGSNFILEPGIWIREYKTFAASRDRSLYIDSWRTNMQADFQIHALQHHLSKERGMPVKVNGIFIDIIEKPAPYVPKHTCKECKVVSKREDWVPSADAGSLSYICPSCGNRQELNLANKSKKERVPEFYRFAVSRTPEELERSKGEIRKAAARMQELRGKMMYHDCDNQTCMKEVDHRPARSPERCIETVRGVSAKCDYWAPHVAGVEAKGYTGYVQIERPVAYTGVEGA